MAHEELQKALELHLKWLRGQEGGSRADLSRADLSGADLSGADLSEADLSGAVLSRANLSRANLSRADLSGAVLSRANLSRAYLSGADLSGADLSGADLSGADLSGAVLNWQSHDLLAEILLREAGRDMDRRTAAGLILVSRDLCWVDFVALELPCKSWAVETLRRWAQQGKQQLPLDAKAVLGIKDTPAEEVPDAAHKPV